MPPFAGTAVASSAPRSRRPGSEIVTLNVGGQIFQTTRQTLTLAGPKSLLSSPPPFIDRDPHLFSLLLSLLRTGRLPSPNPSFDLADLISEAEFYGLDPFLLSNPTHFDAFDLQKSLLLPLNGRDSPSALATAASGSIHVAHGGKITSFDWSLRRKTTILTGFPAVDSLLVLDPSTAAAGAADFAGLQILNLSTGSLHETLHWSAIPGSGSAVQAIGSSPDLLFGSFESVRRNASAILAFDRSTFKPVAEIGRQEIYGAELDSAIPATKLRWINGSNLLLASGSHAGPSGLSGNLRLWDVRSGGKNAVWEVTERSDCFADVTVSDSMSAVFKVGVNSGEVYMADLRMLSKEEPWVGLGPSGRVGNNGKKEGSGCLIESHGDKVFVSRGGEVEIWSEILMGNGVRKGEDGLVGGERVMRRNLMGRVKEVGGKKITMLGFGGRRMVVARKGEQCVEVWESVNARC